MDISLTAQDGHQLTAYVQGPEDARAGVVILPEIFGINPYIRSVVDRYAALGYRAITPSLFDRQTGAEPGLQLGYDSDELKRGLALRRAISDDTARLDIEAAASALTEQATVFLTGFCWGGYLSWRMACLSTRFTAASCWHGGGIARHSQDVAHIPVQMHFGEQDTSIPLADVEQIRTAQPQVALYVYPDAGHAFGREGTPAWRPEQAKLAWQRTLAFFAQHGGPAPQS